MKKARGEVRRLLIVINELQSMIGNAQEYHGNDRDRNGFEKGQKILRKAFDLCVNTTGDYEPIVIKKKKLTADERRVIAKIALDAVITPKVLDEANEMHKRLSRVPFEELHREFTI